MPDNIATLKRLLAEAIPGPFTWKDGDAGCLIRPSVWARGKHLCTTGGPNSEGDATANLIASVLSSLPALLEIAEAADEVQRTLANSAGDWSELDRLRAALAKLEVL